MGSTLDAFDEGNDINIDHATNERFAFYSQ